VDVEFSIDAFNVALDRRVADAQFIGDFLVGEALDEQFEDFHLAG
jgi:hypothetical protein